MNENIIVQKAKTLTKGNLKNLIIPM